VEAHFVRKFGRIVLLELVQESLAESKTAEIPEQALMQKAQIPTDGIAPFA
jgi:hypothetical protein